MKKNALTDPDNIQDRQSIHIRSKGMLVRAIITTQDTVVVAPVLETPKGIGAVMESPAVIEGRDSLSHHPWEPGRGDDFQPKHLIILPGCSVSLQSHHQRSERWMVIAGKAKAECEGIERTVLPNVSLFIPQGTVHLLTNEGDDDLQIIEVNHLDVDDAVRDEALCERA